MIKEVHALTNDNGDLAVIRLDYADGSIKLLTAEAWEAQEVPLSTLEERPNSCLAAISFAERSMRGGSLATEG